MRHEVALDEGLSKVIASDCQNTDGSGQSHDGNRQRPTTHLHRFGHQKEQGEERDRTRHRQMISSHLMWMIHLNTRVDLTLKKVVRQPLGLLDHFSASDQGTFDQALFRLRLQHRGKGVPSRLIDASGHEIKSRQVNLPERPLASTATVDVWVTEDMIYAGVTRFLNNLNGLVLKKPRKARRARSPRIDALVFLEYSPLRGRPHLHALLERPAYINHQDFQRMVLKAWYRQSVSHREHRIEPLQDLRASLAYDAKAAGAWDRVVYQHHEPDETASWRHHG